MIEILKDWLAVFMSRYVMPDWEAHQRAARLETSANAVHYRSEMLRYRKRALQAEKHVRMFMQVSDVVVKEAINLPQEDMSPFVHSTVLEMENARRYVA